MGEWVFWDGDLKGGQVTYPHLRSAQKVFAIFVPPPPPSFLHCFPFAFHLSFLLFFICYLSSWWAAPSRTLFWTTVRVSDHLISEFHYIRFIPQIFIFTIIVFFSLTVPVPSPPRPLTFSFSFPVFFHCLSYLFSIVFLRYQRALLYILKIITYAKFYFILQARLLLIILTVENLV